jgi:hypothetical protein
MPPVKVTQTQTIRSRVLYADDLLQLERDVLSAEAKAKPRRLRRQRKRSDSTRSQLPSGRFWKLRTSFEPTRLE